MVFKLFGGKKKSVAKTSNTDELSALEATPAHLMTEEEKKKLALLKAKVADEKLEQKINPQENALLRYSFYRDGYRSMVKANLILAGVTAFSILWNIYNTVNHESVIREYFSVDDNGRVIPIYPNSEPILTPKQLNHWLIQALGDIYDMTATNYRTVINSRIPQYFTTKGLETYKEALNQTNRIPTLVDNHLMMSAVPAGTPVIYDQGVINNRYFWRVRMPLRISYQGNGKIATEIRLVNVLITRVNTQQYREGVAINQLVESEVLTDQQIK